MPKHELFPEPGTHVLDGYAGLPKMNPPQPLEKGVKIPTDIIFDYVSYEGLGYCIHTYIQPEAIKDPVLRELWIKTKKDMQSIVTHLERHGKRKRIKKTRTILPRKKVRKAVFDVDDLEEL